MRLKKSRSAAEEELVGLLNAGHSSLDWVVGDYRRHRHAGTFSEAHIVEYQKRLGSWIDSVTEALLETFPTSREANAFRNAPPRIMTAEEGTSIAWNGVKNRFHELLAVLESVIDDGLSRYTDLPVVTRVFVEAIDSFRKVRDVNPAEVAHLLKDGRIELAEDEVQKALEQILTVPQHQKDWGGEYNDLYTANVELNGARVPTAFALKGKGLKAKMLEIADCGKNGDQLVRLFESPATLFVIQYVGEVSQAVIKDAEGKVNELRARGKNAVFCVMNGQDTARLFYAYGKLPR